MAEGKRVTGRRQLASGIDAYTGKTGGGGGHGARHTTLVGVGGNAGGGVGTV